MWPRFARPVPHGRDHVTAYVHVSLALLGLINVLCPFMLVLLHV
jgi:hypothetical protein